MIQPDAYKDSLCLLCRQSARMETYLSRIKSGKKINRRKLETDLQLLYYAKSRFLSAKKEEGLDGDLDFMEDMAFSGFKYKDGCLEGDYEKLVQIAETFARTGKGFKYEVGILIFSHYLEQESAGHWFRKTFGSLKRFLQKAYRKNQFFTGETD